MAIHGGSRCLDPDDLAALLHDRIEPASQRAMEEHVAACSQCRELLSALAQTEEPPRLATRRPYPFEQPPPDKSRSGRGSAPALLA